MRKIFCILFLFLLSFLDVFSDNELKIITRSEWWANENYRYIDSDEWKKVLEEREKNKEKEENTVYSQKQIDEYHKKQSKIKKMNEILLNDFWDEIEIDKKSFYENWRKLAWPVYKTKKVKWIVIHHTYSEYENSLEWVNKVYKYHALTREWWDIWYNYLIWKDWEIYEWRAGWDYVVAAHDKWNNRWTVWIALIWNYSDKEINKKQYNSLKRLSVFLINKYKININEKTYFHEECIWDDCKKPLKSELKDFIVWHRDAWHTSCPWDKLYFQIDTLKKDIINNDLSIWNIYKKKIYKKLSKFSDEKLIKILAKIEYDLDDLKDSRKQKIKWYIIDYFKYKNDLFVYNNSFEEKEDNKIKIKLSYPDNDKIKIKSWRAIFDITRKWNHIYVKWQKYNVLKIPKKYNNTILKILSWDRIPEWDKEWKYNDNIFRWDIILYVKDNKLIVVNSLNVEDYLKWLWEVSNFEDYEKIKTIIIAARSYAKWYTKVDRKFKWEFYDWVDDPNVFQKYLWYWLEERSPNINKVVEETKWQIITYNWKLIKPWYFSRSNWSTMSFYEYCSIRYPDTICINESRKYPYLQSVFDKWSEWKEKAGHWVGISWSWVSYFSKKWWSYDMIIKYFLRWVEIS